MGKSNKLILKPGKEKPVLQRHHWIFSGAVSSTPDREKGSIVPVHDSQGTLLGHAMYHPDVNIIGRMISFGPGDPLKTIQANIEKAWKLRKLYFNESETNAFRIVNGEGDFLPGLVVDKYSSVLVIQLLTAGMDAIRDVIVDTLVRLCSPKTIFEKSMHGSRKEEGIPLREGTLHGDPVEEVGVVENGLRFVVAPEKGQKTGFFLDQREMRSLVRQLSGGKRILNCFAYTGGFSIYALAGGASTVHSVESSEPAQAMERRHVSLNNLYEARYSAFRSDVFDFLKKHPLDHDLVILDPPAYAKKRGDLKAACRGYRDLNRLAMEKMVEGSMLLTCSCSGHISTELFQKIIFQAALAADRKVRIIGRHRLAADHPVNIYHPETEYLKSFLLQIQ